MAKAKGNLLVEQIRAMGAEPFRYFNTRRESYKADGVTPADAVVSAHADTVAKFLSSESTDDMSLDLNDQSTTPPKPPAKGTAGLFDRSVFKTVEPLAVNKVLPWVASMMFIADVEPGEAPNSDAWGWLQWCRQSPANMAEFYRSIYPKLLPTKTQLEQQARFHDDGNDDLELIERVRAAGQAALLSDGAKVVRSKHGFSGDVGS